MGVLGSRHGEETIGSTSEAHTMEDGGGEAIHELEEQSVAVGESSSDKSEGKGKEGEEKEMKRNILLVVSNELS